MASMELLTGSGSTNAPEVLGPVSGIMILEMITAATALRSEAVRICPMTLGMISDKILA